MIEDVGKFEDEVIGARQEINSDSYPMSIGELTNLHKDGELIINPAFQRLFRWDQEQKSRLIESVLLDIPLPSIFISQAQDGKWELIDGLQRVSTLLQLQGLLPGYDPLVLQGTKYLPSLEGRVWDGPEDINFPQSLKLDFKRSKLDLKIIKRDSSPKTKYDLFQRLNSFGSPLTAQEMRNALLVGISTEFAQWVSRLADDENFTDTTALSDRQVAEKYSEDLVLRFLFLHDRVDINSVSLRGFNQKLDDASINMASTFPGDRSRHDFVFSETFRLLGEHAGPDAFRKWDDSRQKFSGGFSNTAFEIMAMGLGFHLASGTPYRLDLRAAAKEFWTQPDMNNRFATGVATETRLSRTLPIGRTLLAAR